MKRAFAVLFGSVVSLLTYVLLTSTVLKTVNLMEDSIKIEKIYVDGGYVCFKSASLINCTEMSKEEARQRFLKEQGREQ